MDIEEIESEVSRSMFEYISDWDVYNNFRLLSGTFETIFITEGYGINIHNFTSDDYSIQQCINETINWLSEQHDIIIDIKDSYNEDLDDDEKIDDYIILESYFEQLDDDYKRIFGYVFGSRQIVIKDMINSIDTVENLVDLLDGAINQKLDLQDAINEFFQEYSYELIRKIFN